MTTFALIRHAEHRLVGHTMVGRASGVRLSPEGVGQAERLAERLAGSSIGALYSSPLERAVHTAVAIAARVGVEVEVAEELNEIEFGAWTNRTLEDLRPVEEWRRFY